MTTFCDLPLDIFRKIMNEKVDLETRDIEGFASRFEILKVTKSPSKELASRDWYVKYVILYKPTQKVVKGYYMTENKDESFDLKGALRLLKDSCNDCELGDSQNRAIYQGSLGIWNSEDVEYEYYVLDRNRRILMKKVLGETDYNIFVRIGSPFANWTFKRVD